MAETLRVGDREIGPGRPTFFVAEEGQANQGNLGVAREMIRVAAWAQADAIEFQLAIADDFYIRAHPGHAIYKAREFTADELRSLFATAQEAGILADRGEVQLELRVPARGMLQAVLRQDGMDPERIDFQRQAEKMLDE